MTRLQNIQTRILKIIHKNCFVENIAKCKASLYLEALMYHYEDLNEIYKKSNSITTSKRKKAVNNNNSYMVSLKTYSTQKIKKFYSNENNSKYTLNNKL